MAFTRPKQTAVVSRGTLEGTQAKRLKQDGKLGYTGAAREGLRVAVVSEKYPECQLSKENFVDIQQELGRIVDKLPEEGFIPGLVDSHWAKGSVIMICLDEETKNWWASSVSALEAWEGSRLKVVGLYALHTYKSVVACFPGPVEEAERYLLRFIKLNRGLDIGH